MAAVAALAVAFTLPAFVPSVSGANDGLYVSAEPTGWACFAQADITSVYNVGHAYDIGDATAALATLQGRSGRGVSVQYVRLNTIRDPLTVVLTKPAAYDVCATFHLQQMNGFGWSSGTPVRPPPRCARGAAASGARPIPLARPTA